MHVLGLFWIVQVEIENFGFFEISTNKCGWTLRRWFGLSILWFCSKEYRLLYRSLAPKTDHKWTKYGPNSNSFISSIILIWPHFRNIWTVFDVHSIGAYLVNWTWDGDPKPFWINFDDFGSKIIHENSLKFIEINEMSILTE